MHPLYTGRGCCATDAMPFDHRHHKGVMYALRCADQNFWEEDDDQAECGMQKVTDVHLNEAGHSITLDLLWTSYNEPRVQTYRELRTITCTPSEYGFRWTWRSQRTALRDHRLIKSEWSMEDRRGIKINYHGLGIRLPRSFAVGEEGNTHGFESNGVDMPAEEGHGSVTQNALMWSLIDGYWDAPKVSVRLEQESDFTLFALRAPITYLAMGPSNLEEIDVKTGQTFDETYHVTVEDIP